VIVVPGVVALKRRQALGGGRQAAGRCERGQEAICQINLEDPDLAGASLDRIQEAAPPSAAVARSSGPLAAAASAATSVTRVPTA
jgi:hypothetical protein